SARRARRGGGVGSLRRRRGVRGRRARGGADACHLKTQGALLICSKTNNGRLSPALRLVQRAIMADLPADLPALNDLQVLRFNEWCRLSGISTRTGRRLLAAGTGPATVRLSSKRMGVTVGAHRQWLASRERA